MWNVGYYTVLEGRSFERNIHDIRGLGSALSENIDYLVRRSGSITYIRHVQAF